MQRILLPISDIQINSQMLAKELSIEDSYVFTDLHEIKLCCVQVLSSTMSRVSQHRKKCMRRAIIDEE